MSFLGTLRTLVRHPRAHLVLTAFLLRLGWVLLVPSRPVGDFALYREAASYLLAHGHLDPEFIYMPGYVMVLAAIEALGGGLLAAKMAGVVAGTLVVASVGEIAAGLFGRRAGIIATALGAAWPAGIAVASVTGTDMPAAALMSLAVAALVRLGPRRPLLAAVLCGLLFGLAAWVRAVAVPLAALTLFYWRARRPPAPWRLALGRAALAAALALAVLSPWALRNRALYGTLSFTDAHGGHTALVGANPNSEGTYSRSLNLMFEKGTGYKLFETPERHHAADRTAYALARRWSRFEPAYAIGLIGAKADRLLGHERNLLYWPIFRAGVLGPSPVRAFFDRHRGVVEGVADGYWWALAVLAAAGLAVAARSQSPSGTLGGFALPSAPTPTTPPPALRAASPNPPAMGSGRQSRPSPTRQAGPTLAVLAFPAALTGIYTLFFAEVRYHLAIVPFLMPLAARALDWLGGELPGDRSRRQGWTAAIASAAVLLLVVGGYAVRALGDDLRARHRWAVATCRVQTDGERASAWRLCAWRRVLPVGGPSPVRGAWDGVGLRLDAASASGAAGAEVLASAATTQRLPAGHFRIGGAVSLSGAPPAGVELAVSLRVAGRVIARVLLSGDAGASGAVAGAFDHPGGDMILEVEVERASPAPLPEGLGVWLSDLIVQK